MHFHKIITFREIQDMSVCPLMMILLPFRTYSENITRNYAHMH